MTTSSTSSHSSFIQFIILLITVSVIMGQTPSSSPTCGNSNLQMTPSLRQKILDAMNDARNALKTEPILLYNGEYALPAAEMPDLTWSCEIEEEIHQYLQNQCDSVPVPWDGISSPNAFPQPDYTWSYFGMDITDPESFIQSGLNLYPKFLINTNDFLSRSPVFTGTHGSWGINIFNANAETVGCAIYECDVRDKPHNAYPANFTYQIMCSVDPKIQFGEELYQVSAPNYIPPSQDVICPKNGIFDIELREILMNKINEIRSEISAGSYQLVNLETALQASNMNNLAWSCDEEAAIAAEPRTCDTSTFYDPAKEFQKIIHPTTFWINNQDIKAFVTQLKNEFFESNPNFNFLSQYSTYSVEYPAAFALSDQATTFACNVKYCNFNSGFHPDFHFICRAKPETQMNTPIYQTI